MNFRVRWLNHILPATVALLLGILLSTCQATPTPPPTATPAISPSPSPMPSPTLPPLGQSGNPIVFGFILPDGEPSSRPEINEIVTALTNQTGYQVQAEIFPNEAELLESMRTGRTHLAFLQPLPYLYASEQRIADIALLSNHFGVYFYGTQFMANIESGFVAYYDPNTDQSSADAATALQQLSGKRPCWIENASISGYLLPASLLASNNIPFPKGVLTLSPTASVRALYIKGICDYAATFAISGDPRTSPAVLNDLPDARERIIVLWRSDAIIPNLGLAVHPALPAQIRADLIDTMQQIARNNTGKAVLSRALDYDIQDLRIVDDSIYDPIRQALQALSLNPQDFIGH